VPPPNTELTEVGLSARRPFDEVSAEVFERPNPHPPTQVYRYFQGGFRSRAHLYIEDAKELGSGKLWIGLRSERRGLLLGAAIAAALVAAVLSFFALATHAIVQQPSTASSLLSLAPGVIAAFLVRPGEHLLARKLNVWPRFFLIGSAAMSFAAAACLIALLPSAPPTHIHRVTAAFSISLPSSVPVPEGLQWTLRCLALGAIACLALLLVSVAFPRAQRQDQGVPDDGSVRRRSAS
jgi:hypothetical protein